MIQIPLQLYKEIKFCTYIIKNHVFNIYSPVSAIFSMLPTKVENLFFTLSPTIIFFFFNLSGIEVKCLILVIFLSSCSVSVNFHIVGSLVFSLLQTTNPVTEKYSSGSLTNKIACTLVCTHNSSKYQSCVKFTYESYVFNIFHAVSVLSWLSDTGSVT